jgi:hypothetical protein
VEVIFLTPIFPRRSHADQSPIAVMTFVRLFRAGIRRSLTSTKPTALACLMAFLTTVLQTPASAAMASIGNEHVPPFWHWRPMTERTASSPGVKCAASRAGTTPLMA